MNTLQILALALALDYAFGDPDRLWKRFPHPVVLMGRVVDWFDLRFNQGQFRRAKGIVAVVLISILAVAIGLIIRAIPNWGVLDVIVLSILLAHKSLIDHIRAVASGLSASIDYGRTEVAKIVGRDVRNMDESAVAAAAIESGAENFSDGFVAPVFWFLVLGLPGVILYKFVNTADSMIGHMNDKYMEFGFGAAKLDDLMNWVPARLCGGLICITHWSREAFTLMQSEAPLHRSPNAGWPEAAMAAVLDVRLSGPRSYGDTQSDDLYINPMGQKILGTETIRDAISVLQRSWLSVFSVAVSLALITWVF